MHIPSYLQRNRYGIFHFRRAIPARLRHIAGKREIVLSLRTRDPKIGIQRARHVALQVDNWFIEIAEQMGKKKKSSCCRTSFEVIYDIKDDILTATKKVDPEVIKAMSDAGCSPEQITKAVSEFNAAPLPPSPSQATVTNQRDTPTTPDHSGILLSELITRYEEGRKANKPFGKSQKARYRRLLEILDDRSCTTITREQARMVLRIPVKMNTDSGRT